MIKKQIIIFFVLAFSCFILGCNKKDNESQASILAANGFEILEEEDKVAEPFSKDLKAILEENDFKLDDSDNLSDEEIGNAQSTNQIGNYIETPQGCYIHESIIKEEVEIRLKEKLEEIEKTNKTIFNQELQKAKDNFEINERKQIEIAVAEQLNIRILIIKLIIISIFSVSFLFIVVLTIKIVKEKNKSNELVKSYEHEFFDKLSTGSKTIAELRKEIRKNNDICQTAALNNIESQYIFENLKREISELYEQINDQFAAINVIETIKMIDDDVFKVLDTLYSLGRNVHEKCYDAYLSTRNISQRKYRQTCANFLFFQSKKYSDFAEHLESKIDKESKFNEKLKKIVSLYKSNAADIKGYAEQLERKK